MSPTKAPYGTWTSPITAEAITKGANSIVDVIVDKITSEVYHLEGRPSEGGRNVLVHTASGRDVVGAGWNVRTGVQEYGGGAAIVYNKVAYFSHRPDGRVYRVEEGKEPEPITPGDKPYRYACLELHPQHPHLLISVLEDHTVDLPAEIVTTLVIIDTIAKTVNPLISGADFYAQPKFSPSGARLAWQQWFHPDMPWEGGLIHVADVVVADGKISIKNEVHVAGIREKVSAAYPAWANDETLVFTSDVSGYINPWKFKDGKAELLFPAPESVDFGHTMWILQWFPYAIIDKEGHLGLFSAIKDGQDALYLVDLKGGSAPKLINAPFVVIECVRTVSFDNHQIVFAGQTPVSTKSVIKASLTGLTDLNLTVIKAPDQLNPVLTPALISQPKPIALSTPPNNDPLHVVFYPPHNPAYAGSSIEGEKPPCIVNVHGGPTSLTAQSLSWSKQYFTTRGFAWLDVNYGGSSGYGRKYIERLSNNWGVVDVEDCILAAKTLSSAPYNLIDPKRVVIRGGSAGGFTVLAALSIGSDLNAFAGGTSMYGVSDLQKLSEFTHKFESQYLNKLIGGTFEEVPQVYRDRSPVYHADKIVSPLLILQGELDKVVPKDQAEAIYNSIKERGGVVEYKLYPGEDHGWRQEVTMRDALERELGFYERVLKLKN